MVSYSPLKLEILHQVPFTPPKDSSMVHCQKESCVTPTEGETGRTKTILSTPVSSRESTHGGKKVGIQAS